MNSELATTPQCIKFESLHEFHTLKHVLMTDLVEVYTKISSEICSSRMFVIGHYKHSAFTLDSGDEKKLFDIAMCYTKKDSSVAVAIQARLCLIVESCILVFALLRPSDWDSVIGHVETHCQQNHTLLMALFQQAFSKIVYFEYSYRDEFSLYRHFLPIQWDTSLYKIALQEETKLVCDQIKQSSVRTGPFGTVRKSEKRSLVGCFCDVVDVPRHVVQDAMLAFCMGNHQRLGAESVLSNIDTDIFSLVFDSVLHIRDV
jgi:hypothetical protein